LLVFLLSHNSDWQKKKILYVVHVHGTCLTSLSRNSLGDTEENNETLQVRYPFIWSGVDELTAGSVAWPIQNFVCWNVFSK